MFVTRKTPTLIRRPSEPGEDPPVAGSDRGGGSPAKIAFVVDLDLDQRWTAGPGFELWERLVAPLPRDGATLLPSLDWLAAAAARASVVIALGSSTRDFVELLRGYGRKLGGSPDVIVGTFIADELDLISSVANYADGVVVSPRRDDEVEAEAERFRRDLAWLPERLVVERGDWTSSPLLAVQASADVLVSLPRNIVDFALLFEEPRREIACSRSIIACVPYSSRPWWCSNYSHVGPRTLSCPPWSEDPRLVR